MTTIHPEAGTAASNQFGTFEVHYATEPQVNYIRSLFASRNAADAGENLAELNELYAQVQTGKVSKKAASRGIDLLLALPVAVSTGAAPKPAGVRLASEKQVALIVDLLEKREGAREVVYGHVTALGLTEVEELPIKEASAVIDNLFALPKLTVAKAGSTQFAAGMYVAPDGRIFRAYLGQQSGNILCKEVVRTEGHEHEYELEYRGLAAKHIPADSRRMTLEEAKAWGKATGSCVRCGRRLDVPESVDAGIGPVCAGKGEW